MRNLLRRRKAASVFVAIVVVVLGTSVHGQPQSSSPASAIHFEDVTRTAGIKFINNSGAFGKKWLPETMGSGVAFLDYDNDGWQDILFVNGTDFTGHGQHHTTLALYHNNHDGTFTDVTHKAGLAVEMYGMGVAIGDYDNDGYDDIFITALRPESSLPQQRQRHVYRRHETSRPRGPNEFSTSAAWVDYDKDGHLDLVVANYVQWTPETDLPALSTARRNPIARRSHIKERQFASGTIAVTALSRTPRRRLACSMPRPRA